MLELATITPGEPEIFLSEQGEGPSAGLPSVFVRLSRCNLHCVWCDTAYTWRFSDEFAHRNAPVFKRDDNRVRMDVEEVAERVRAFDCNRLILTGGEPLLQGPLLAKLVAALKAERPGLYVEIETNGTVEPVPSLDALVDQYNVSPKLAHSGNDLAQSLPPVMLDRWANDERAFFKFVVADLSHVDEVTALQSRHAIPGTRLFLMPEGTDSATLKSREPWVRTACEAHGWRFTDRLHIHLYGDTRGT